MKNIIAPVDRNLLLEELDSKKFIRNTNKGGNQIYIITAKDSPNVMKEIGRLREWSFRLGGGGSGEEIDVVDRTLTLRGLYLIYKMNKENDK